VHRDSAPESLRFLVIGDLIPRKAPEVAVSALRQVSGPAELHFVGDGPLRGSLLAMAEHVNLDNVHFHGRIAYREVCAKLSCADVLVFPSRWDGFGMATLEALAAGLPVIASNRVMSALQYVRPGVNGWVFPVDDVAALAERMQFVIDHREDLPKWSAAALATLSEYNPMRDASRLAELLRFVSSSQKGSGTARTPGSSPSAVVGS
jgi:glycosyltransferase involved in cell wall biosynthesis